MNRPFHIPVLDLIPLDDALLAEIAADPVAALKRLGDKADLHELIAEIAAETRTHQARVGAIAPWIGYLAQDPDTSTIVGTCSYKGNPSADGLVEIAFFTFTPFEGYGVATAMAQELLVRAFAEAVINGVFAHTLPRKSASTTVLDRVGMRRVGDAQDPEDGRVWRWELRR